MGPTFYEIELIGSGFLAVMAKPVAGEWIDDEFSSLANAGLHRVVSLLEPHEAYEVGLGDEESLCEKYGMSFVSCPVADCGWSDYRYSLSGWYWANRVDGCRCSFACSIQCR